MVFHLLSASMLSKKNRPDVRRSSIIGLLDLVPPWWIYWCKQLRRTSWIRVVIHSWSWIRINMWFISSRIKRLDRSVGVRFFSHDHSQRTFHDQTTLPYFSVRNCQLPQVNGKYHLSPYRFESVTSIRVCCFYLIPNRLCLRSFYLTVFFSRLIQYQPSTQGELAACSFIQIESSTIWSKSSRSLSLIVCHIFSD